MMNDLFKIYVDRLGDGKTQKIDESVSPDFLGIQEKELAFVGNIAFKGEAYVANHDSLVLYLTHITAQATLPCVICNEKTTITIAIENFYYTARLKEIKSGIFDFKEILREEILLEIPSFVECHEGECPQRSEIKKYMKKAAGDKSSSDEEGYHPFAEL